MLYEIIIFEGSVQVFQVNNAELFADREEEVEAITKALTTGDVLVLGEAGIGKTAIINKIVDNLTNQKEPQTIVICLNATPHGYLAGYQRL